MLKKILVIGLLGCGVMGLWGCAAMSKKDKSMGGPTLLEPQAILKFADLPIPAGFKLLPQDSYSFESSGVRVAVLKYQGKANPDRVVNFYKEQMLMYNWDLVNIIEYGQRLMNFERENETCVINLSSKGNSVILTISLGPKSQMPRKSEKPVK